MNAFRKLMIGAAALFAGAGVTACGSGGVYIDPYYGAWYDVYGNYCFSGYPAPGCNFFSNGTKADYWDDPYSASLEYNTWEYWDSWGNYRIFSGWGRLTYLGILYDEYGYALNEEDSANDGRDLMADAANLETAKVKEAAAGLSANYALAESSSVKIASTLNDWATLGKKHARTEADVKAFSEKLFGVNADAVKAGLDEVKATRDLGALNSLNQQVASSWNTDPETSKEILMSWYKKDLAAAGL